MIVVQLTGGLGNQLFQYAAGKALSLHHNTELKLDISYLVKEKLPELEIRYNFELNNFEGITEQVINLNNLPAESNIPDFKNGLLSKLLPAWKRQVYKEPHYHFDNCFFKSNNPILLKGGWQSFKYFEKYNAEILGAAKIKIEAAAKQNFDNIISAGDGVVAIHVRRGDYMRMPIILDWHGVMDKTYYAGAFEQLAKRTTIKRVLYFTNDAEWVQKELFPLIPGEIISNTVSPNHCSDFYLMQQCSHNIIANSTFSWWPAYLNANPNKIVIAPKRWFNKAPYDTKDLIPESWIRI